jgi:hypothetical protein
MPTKMKALRALLSLCAAVISIPDVEAQFNNPPGVDIWCGKPYKAGSPNFDPGGRLAAPTALSDKPFFNLKVYPRHNMYLENDASGSFIIDTAFSYTHGVPYCSVTETPAKDSDQGVKFNFVIFRADTGQTVVERADVPVNTTGFEAPFGIIDFQPRMEPYDIILRTTNVQCGRTYQAETKLYRFPMRTDGGSVARVDHKFGGISVTNTSVEYEAVWKKLFPYSFYVDWGNYLSGSIANLTKFAEAGYNIIHPTPGDGVMPWGDWKKFDTFLDEVEKRGMYLMYDMRWTFKNLTSVTEQVNRYKSRKSILTWYTGDEPDGQGDPLDSTVKAYNTIKAVDPYHPVSLVLNCDNFHYGEYAAGADIVMTDPYPIGTNTTFSVQYKTVCNLTYGDCGCDNCIGNFSDISTRMDKLKQYQSWLNLGPKTVWGVPQAFGGSEYWSRPPSAAEEIVMATMFINHDAKGIVAWNFPTTDELASITSQFAKAIGADEITEFLVNSRKQQLTLSSQQNFDAAVWRSGKRLLFSVVHTMNVNYTRELRLGLGANATGMRMVWPPNAENWFLADKSIVKPGMGPLEVNLFILETD